ncbi:ANK2 [Symbiodinium sp. KB8]|nr:ANK2 [Symbiodinium sp. KB8]
MWASMSGRADVVAALLAAHAEAKLKDSQGMTALMWATRHGHVDVMRLLLGDGPDLSITDFGGHSVMHHARQHKAARKMLERFEALNRHLLNSAKSGDLNEASMALEAGAFVDTLDADGASPLLHAASQRNLSMVRLLTRHGADPSLEASRASSPWLRNAEYQTSIQEVLRDAVKANKLLVSAAKEGWWKGVFQAIEHGAWLEIPDESQKTPLGWAASHGSVQAVRHLIQARASLNAREQCGWTPIHWAAHRNWAEVASVLHYHNADVHAKAFSGDTIVHLAAKSNHCFSLVLLSCASASLDVKGFEGRTPLQATAIGGKVAAMLCLLKLRADASVRGEGGRSLTALAALHGQHALLDALLEKTSGGPVAARSEKASKRRPKDQEVLEKAGAKLEKVVEFPDAEEAPSQSTGKPRKGEGHGKDADKDHSKKDGSERKPSPTRSHSGKDQRKEARDDPESKGIKEGSHLEVPKSSTRAKLQKEGSKAHLEPTEPAESVSAVSQQSWRSRKTDVSEDEEEKAKRIKVQKQPDMALYEQAEAFNKSLPAKVDFSVSQALAEVDDDGRTPLGLAVQAGHVRVTSLLLERKASLEVADKTGNTILMLAARGSSRTTLMIVEHLLAARADVQARNDDKCTAADVAKVPKVRELLKNQIERLQVGKKLSQSQSLPALKAPAPERRNSRNSESEEPPPQPAASLPGVVYLDTRLDTTGEPIPPAALETSRRRSFMNFAAPPPWAAEATPCAQHSLADLAGAAVPFPGVPWAPASRKAPVNFLPAWQELQLQNQQLPQNAPLPLHQPVAFPAPPGHSQGQGQGIQGIQSIQSQGGMKSARNPPAQSFGFAFPGELTDEQEKKEKKRRQQQEMQMALAAQIKEQRARKETESKSEARAEAAPKEEPGPPGPSGPSGPWEGMGRSGPQLGPRQRRPEPEPDQRELERRRQQQELTWERELQRVLAAQVEEAKQRKEEARQRQKEEEDREEQRLRREIEEENQKELRKAEKHEAKKASRAREADTEARETATGRSTRTRERFRDEPWRESQSGRLRKTRDRLRDTRHGRSRRTRNDPRDCEASPSRDFREWQSPVPSAGPADTAGTWAGTCSPPPRRKGDRERRDGRDGREELGFQGFVEQQRLLASEMQRQVLELRNQRDEAREQALKVKEDAINDRHRHLQELQQCLLDQLQSKPEPSKASQEIENEKFKENPVNGLADDLPEVWEHSIASHSRFVAIDAGLAVLHGALKQPELPHASVSEALVSPLEVSHKRDSPAVQCHDLNALSYKKSPEQPAAAPPHSSPLPASEQGSSTGGASPNFRLTEQLDKDKAAAFRKALDTASGLPADLRDDLCALLEESVETVMPPVVPVPSAAQGSRAGRPPVGKSDVKGEGIPGIPFPSGPQRPHASRARSSTPGTAELTTVTAGRRHSREERRAHSAAEASRREASGRVRLEHLPANVPPDILEDAILTLVSLRRAPQPRAIEVAVHPITQRTLGHAYVDYDDEVLAIQLADAKCDAKKDPFRGTVQLLKEECFRPMRRASRASQGSL